MVDIAVIDFETRSRADLKKVGAWRYSLDPSTEVLCLAYSINGSEVKTWSPGIGLDCPADLSRHVRGKGLLWAHNVPFERAVWENIMFPLSGYEWPRVFEDQWRDTMASCAYQALPLALEKAAKVLRLRHQKDMTGNRIMHQLAKPKRDGSWDEDFEKHQRNMDYCADDVRAEAELLQHVGELPEDELRVWKLDQKINRRGIGVDLDAVEAGIAVATEVEQQLTGELRTLTHSAVETAGQVEKLKNWITLNAPFEMPDLQSETVEQALTNPKIEPDVRRVLEIRQELGKSATKKLIKMRDCAVDGRLYDLLQYHGASTGRWSGRLTQPQNFVRPQLNDGDGVDPEQIISDLMTRDVEYLTRVYGSAITALSDAMRPMLWAGPDSELVAADLSGIEARVLAWLAGEQWKLDAFRKIDRGEERDIYSQTADQIFGFRVEKKDHPLERQVGKTCELAFGYQGGVGAWRGFDSSDRHTDPEVDQYKNTWRDKHPNIVALWRGLDQAAISAMVNGKSGYAGIEYRKEEGKLSCRLPSGRKLWYNEPRIIEKAVPWDEEDFRPAVQYKAWRYGMWRPIDGYGGIWTENVVQAIARDVMVEGMFNAEATDLPIVLTVHDELVTQPNNPSTDTEEILRQCMTDLSEIYNGLPVAAEPWRGRRYRK